MSWWDYGYQIAGMANRTTLVDNNTWNNSHIALVRHFNATYRVNAPNSGTDCVLVTFKTSFSSLWNKMPLLTQLPRCDPRSLNLNCGLCFFDFALTCLRTRSGAVILITNSRVLNCY